MGGATVFVLMCLHNILAFSMHRNTELCMHGFDFPILCWQFLWLYFF